MTYKISQLVASNEIASLLPTAWLILFPARWFTACVGLLLTLVFVQLLSMALVLIRQTVFAHTYTLGRRLALTTALVVGVAAIWESLGLGIQSSWLRKWQQQ